MMRKQIKKAFASVIACTMAFAFAATAVPYSAMAKNDCSKVSIKDGKAKVDLDKGEYHAYFMIQAGNSWVFRDGYWNKITGSTSKNWGGMQTSLDVTDAIPVDGKVTDAVIKGNGTYTVKVEGLNGSMENIGKNGTDAAVLNLCGFSTDIPYNDETKDTIKFSNVQVSVDGGSPAVQEEGQIDEDATVAPKIFQIDALNTYHTDYNNLILKVPHDSCTVTFDVTGFNYDNPDTVAKTDSSSSLATSASSAATSSDKGGMSTGAVAGIVVVAIIVIAGVVVVVKKKKH